MKRHGLIYGIYKIRPIGKIIAEHQVKRQRRRSESKPHINNKQKYNIDAFLDCYIQQSAIQLMLIVIKTIN